MTKDAAGDKKTGRVIVVSLVICWILLTMLMLKSGFAEMGRTYAIVDTGQVKFFGNRSRIAKPAKGDSFFGQDAQYQGLAPSYQDNGDGTVSDLNTGLMWQKGYVENVSWSEAKSRIGSFNLAGYNDWRMPTIKELYSLILFSGRDPNIHRGNNQSLTPFIDTEIFDFRFGDADRGERIIDAQYWSSTKYLSTTMNGNETAFGVNFADGRIKGYPTGRTRHGKGRFVRFVRGNPSYGQNSFVDNGDGTISDLATGLMWMKADSRKGMNWESALIYAENLKVAGHSDWRVPNAKELHSILDYSRAPAVGGFAAIDPVFEISSIKAENGKRDFPYFWTSTTHAQAGDSGRMAVYMSFGTAFGYMRMPPWSQNRQLMDVHGAGAQRCDLKAGDPDRLPKGKGPQGDVMRINNYVRGVRSISANL